MKKGKRDRHVLERETTLRKWDDNYY